jgi:ubiquitin C-terminal hydrolase
MPDSLSHLVTGEQATIIQTLDGRPVSSGPGEPFTSLDVMISHVPDLLASLAKFQQADLLTGDNRYFDSRTNRKIEATRVTEIRETGPIVFVHLKRFDYDLQTLTRFKIDDCFDFPDALDLCGHHYELTGVILHSGTAEGGHYMSAVRSAADRSWLLINDSSVSVISYDELYARARGGVSGAQSAYVL